MNVVAHNGAVLLLALLVAGHSVAATLPAQLVCRFTGQPMKVDCPCPDRGEERPELAKQGCCELRGATGAPAPGQVPASAPRVPLYLFGLPVEAQGFAAPQAARFEPPPVPDASPPPPGRLFVKLRHLLI